MKKTLASFLPPSLPPFSNKKSYWTIAGVSDEGGITSFDEDFFLWTQSAPSNSGSQLEAVPSAVRAAARQQAAAASQVAPAIGERFIFGAICGAIGPCNELRSGIEDTIRTAFGIPCSRNIGINILTNRLLSIFSFGFLGTVRQQCICTPFPLLKKKKKKCPTGSLLLQRQAQIRPLYYTFNFETKNWEWSPRPKYQIRRSAGEYFVRSPGSLAAGACVFLFCPSLSLDLPKTSTSPLFHPTSKNKTRDRCATAPAGTAT